MLIDVFYNFTEKLKFCDALYFVSSVMIGVVMSHFFVLWTRLDSAAFSGS